MDCKPYRGYWSQLSKQILRRDDYQCRCTGCSACRTVEQTDGARNWMGDQTDGIRRLDGRACSENPCVSGATTVDHINGNPHDNHPTNLRAMCRPCNTAKGGIA